MMIIEGWPKEVSEWSIVVIGLLLLTAIGGQAVIDDELLLVALIEMGLPLVIAVGLIVSGLRLRATRPEQQIARIARWTVGGAVVGIAINVWFRFIVSLQYTPTGEPVVLSLNGAASFMAAGLFLGYYVAEIQRRRQELELSESRFRVLTENARFAVLTIDETSTIRYANNAVEELFGYSSAELIDSPLTTLIPREFRDAHREGFARYLAEGTRTLDWEGIELVGLHSNGEEFPVELRFGEHADSDNHLFTGVIYDITDRKRAEELLQTQTSKITRQHEIATAITAADTREAIYRLAADGADDLFPCDVARVVVAEGDRLVPMASSRNESLDSYDSVPTTAGYVGMTYRSGETIRIADLTDTRSTAASQMTLPTGTPGRAEPHSAGDGVPSTEELPDVYRALLSVPLADYGVLQLLAVAPNVFDDKDEEIAELLASQVTTALKRVEAETTIRRERDHLNEFAGALSHDLRNPLNVAQGRLQLAQETGEMEHLTAIERAHDRIQRLIGDVLTLARQGVDVGEIETVDFGAVAQQAWTNVSVDAATIRINLRRQIEVDRSRLLQVFENLYRNAIEHGGETITVTVGELERGFYVEDTGPGIPSDKRDRVFQSGYSTSDTGTGFGLNIVKRIVEAHGWQITVSEGAEGGARFEILGVEYADG